MDISHVVVVVPAHQEQAQIAGCLRAIGAAVERARAVHPSLSVSVQLVLDACTDRTRAVALRAFGHRAPPWLQLQECAVRCVGEARAIGFRNAPAHSLAWYANTDADSRVPPDWIVAQLESAQRGSDVFVGTVRVHDWHLRDPRVRTLHDAGYRWEPGHGHVHGANLGLRASAYHALGGFSSLSCDEDVGLVGAAKAAGLVIDWSAEACVGTSARTSPRVSKGFSRTLGEIESGLLESGLEARVNAVIGNTRRADLQQHRALPLRPAVLAGYKAA